MGSVGGVSGAAPAAGHGKLIVLSREERLARFAQVPKTKVENDGVKVSSVTPEQHAQRLAHAREFIAARAGTGLEPFEAGPDRPLSVRNPGAAGDLAQYRESLLGTLAPGGLFAAVLAEQGEEAAAAFRAGIENGIRDADRRLGRTPAEAGPTSGAGTTWQSRPASSDAGGARFSEAAKAGIAIGDTPNLTGSFVRVQATREQIDDWARGWLRMQEAAKQPEGPADNAPENQFARVVVNGKPVALVYNSGASMTLAHRAEGVGIEGSGDLAGPDLAMWRAKRYAEALGGTVEMLPTAKQQRDWSPRPDVPERQFSRAELDAAISAMQEQAKGARAARTTSISI